MSITLVIPCSSSDSSYFFDWFFPLVLSNNHHFKYLVILNGPSIPERFRGIDFEGLTIVHIDEPLYPGQARNIALDRISDGHLAFIDSRTVASAEWLDFAYKFHLNYPLGSCLGSALFIPSRAWHIALIASTYGFNLLPCLPGSIIHRRCFSKAGYFLPNVRAGEDIDWIWRASKHNLILDTVMSPPLQYRLNPNLGIIYYARKWFRNYSCTTVLPYVFDGQRTTYVFFLFLAISFVSFVWNSLFANWNELSPLYVPFISRSVVLFLVFLYLILRCIYLPLTKGISFRRLFKYLFPILFISLFLDCVKLFAFLPSIFLKLASRN